MEHAVVGVGGVGVCIEVDQGDVAVPDDVGDPAGIGERDGVVSTKDDGDRAGLSDRGHCGAYPLDALFHVPRHYVDIADIDNGERRQRVDAGVEVRS